MKRRYLSPVCRVVEVDFAEGIMYKVSGEDTNDSRDVKEQRQWDDEWGQPTYNFRNATHESNAW